MMVLTQCMKCKHKTGKSTCAAFPSQIPIDLITDKVIHTIPLPNQSNDIVYEAKDKYHELDEKLNNNPNWKDNFNPIKYI